MKEYKFQSLEVYELGLDYIDLIDDLKGFLPSKERYNLSSQLIRSATSIVINIAEGSTGQSNKEQIRFLNVALRSFLETVACLDLIRRLNYLSDVDLTETQSTGKTLFYWILNLKKFLKD